MLTSAFPTAQPGIGMFFENQPFDQPKGHPWVYVEVIDNFTSKAHIGTPSARYMTVGIVSFEIKVPEDTGTKTMRQIGDSISAILMDQNVAIPGGGSITFYGGGSNEPKPQSGWHTRQLHIEFRAWTTTP